MAATLAPLVDLHDPAAAAGLIAAANARLAATEAVPDDIAVLVAELAASVEESDLAAWEAVDPFLALVFHRGLIEAQDAALRTRDRRRLRIALERMRHALAEIAVAEPAGDERDPAAVARWLASASSLPQAEIAELLGVGVRTFQRWVAAGGRGPDGDDERRLRAVARLVAQLRHALTGVGAIRWFDWPRDDLGGRTPRALLGDPAALPRLQRAAAAVRTSDAV